MLEVVFSDSAAGSMAEACCQGGGAVASSVGVIVGHHEDGSPFTEAETEEYRRQFEERERRAWQNALPFESRREDILCFPLALSVGDIRGEGIGPGREAALKKLMSVYPAEGREAAGELLAAARKSLDTLRARAKLEPVRVWTSQNPDERCGLCWLAAELEALGQAGPFGQDGPQVTAVELPEFLRVDWAPVALPDPADRPDLPGSMPQPDGSVVVSCTGWGEVEPHQLGRLALLGRQLPVGELRALAAQWHWMQKENAPLRAVLNGRLLSADESLYDPYILREIAAQGEEFQQAAVVGRVLGRYQLGIADACVALRMEEFIQNGLLEPVTSAAPGNPVYHRVLRRAGR